MFMLSSMLEIGSGVAGAKLEGEVNAYNYEEKAKIDRFNALVAEQEAKSEMDSTRADVSDFRRIQSARVASSRARQAASGFALEGSPLLVDEAALTEIEFGVSRLIHAGQVKATRLKTQSQLLKRSADVSDVNAKSARRAGTLAAFGAAASGTASYYKTLATMGASFG